MYNVLIVDDKEVFRRKLKRMAYFRENGDKFCIAYEAQNGIEALELLKSNAIDVVLTDIRMPFIDGIELLKRINEQELCGCVLLLSEFADFNYAKAGILNGAFDYILKPVDEEKISEAFERVYGYMNSLSRSRSSEMPDTALLTEFILNGNRMNIITCSNHIAANMRQRCSTEAEAALMASMLLDRLKKNITEKLPYLELYISFPESVCLSDDEGVNAFSDSLLSLSDSIQLLSVPEGSTAAHQACRMILNDPDGTNSIAAIAESLFTTGKYLSALMKREMGRSTVRFITQVKIERAKKLIRDSDMRIGEIAEHLGFTDADYFSKVFKKMTGSSPREYRGEHDEKNRQT